MFNLLATDLAFWGSLIYPFLFSFLISLSLTPLVIKLARSFGFVDDPKKSQHPAILHSTPIPRAGGIAMFLGFVLTTLIFVPWDLKVLGIFFGSFLTVLVGTIDDKWPLSPYWRLFLTQPLAALIVIGLGVRIPGGVLSNPWDGYFFLPPLLESVLLVFWIVWVMNMINWGKGVSQLSGVGVIVFLTIAAVALNYQAGNPDQWRTALLAVILAGACLSFLPFNFPPEKMLPGFGASTFVGFNIAVLSILSGGKLAAALVVLGLPFLDMVIAIARRIKNRKNPLIGDREHFYHRLLDLGFSKRAVIFIYWLVTLLLGVLAIFLKREGKVMVILLLSIIVTSLFVGATLILQRLRRKNGLERNLVFGIPGRTPPNLNGQINGGVSFEG